jgi:hypothetical protein
MSAATKVDAATAACPNSGSSLVDSYCASCGQKAAPVAPGLGYLVHELTHEVLNVDGKIFRTLRLLLTRPGFLTREIFRGRRASYLSPIRAYLIASVLAFAMSALLGRFGDVNIEHTPSPGETPDPAALERLAEGERTIETALNVWMPRAMFVLVPLFAALVMLVRRNSGQVSATPVLRVAGARRLVLRERRRLVVRGTRAVPAGDDRRGHHPRELHGRIFRRRLLARL